MDIPQSEIQFRFARSGGPGGQNVNKRETQVELFWDVEGSPTLSASQRERVTRKLANRIDADGYLRLVVTEERTQGRNRDIAVERLHELLKEALKPDPPKRRKSKPSKAATERRLSEKRRRSQTKRERRVDDED